MVVLGGEVTSVKTKGCKFTRKCPPCLLSQRAITYYSGQAVITKDSHKKKESLKSRGALSVSSL